MLTLILLIASCVCFSLSGFGVSASVNFDGLGKAFAVGAACVMFA